MGEHGRPIFGNVLVEQDASLGIAQQPRQRGLPSIAPRRRVDFFTENDPVTETRTGALRDNLQKMGWTEGQPAGMKIDVECLL
jgi:hypothetical protein